MNLKLTLLMCLLVTAVAGFWGGGRRGGSSSSSSSSSDKTGEVTASINCPGGDCSVSFSGEKTWNDGDTSLNGHITCGSGDCGVGFSITHKFKKALDEDKKFGITLCLSACQFQSYNLNNNEKIEKEELESWFSKDNPTLVNSFMKSLDIDGDSFISATEFGKMAPEFIKGCGVKNRANGLHKGPKK